MGHGGSMRILSWNSTRDEVPLMPWYIYVGAADGGYCVFARWGKHQTHSLDME